MPLPLSTRRRGELPPCLLATRGFTFGVAIPGFGNPFDGGCIWPALRFFHRDKLSGFGAAADVEGLTFVGCHLLVSLVGKTKATSTLGSGAPMLTLLQERLPDLFVPRGLWLVRGANAGPVGRHWCSYASDVRSGGSPRRLAVQLHVGLLRLEF